MISEINGCQAVSRRCTVGISATGALLGVRKYRTLFNQPLEFSQNRTPSAED